jgi:hypothetical protein
MDMTTEERRIYWRLKRRKYRKQHLEEIREYGRNYMRKWRAGKLSTGEGAGAKQ